MRQKDTRDGCSIFSSLAVVTAVPASVWLQHAARLLLAAPATTEWPAPNTEQRDTLGNLFDMCTNLEHVSQETHVRWRSTLRYYRYSLMNQLLPAGTQ